MTTCEHDCEYCDHLADCQDGAAERWREEAQAALEVVPEAVPETNRQGIVDSCFYVYVAGRLSGNPAEYLANLSEMCAASRRLMDAGYVPINPGADALEGLMSGEVLPIEHYQKRSLHLLRLLAGRRAALLVTNMRHRNGSLSGGTRREVDEAREIGIPVVWSEEELAGLRGTEG